MYTFIIILSKSKLKIHISSRTDGENGLRMIVFRMLSNNIRTFWLTFHSWKPLQCFSKYEYFFFFQLPLWAKRIFKSGNFCEVWLKKDFSFQALRKYWSPIVHYLGISVTFTKKKVFRVSLLVFHTKKHFPNSLEK